MKIIQILALALLWSSTSAFAQGQFTERISRSGFDQTLYGSPTPHAEPITRNFSGSQNPTSFATGIVEFANAPAPYIYSSVTSTGMNASLGAYMQYSFDFSGPANTYVPLRFTANFNVRNDNFTTGSGISFLLSAFSL